MLFSPLFLPSDLSEAVGDRAWIAAMLAAEAALARAEAEAGLIPAAAADAIAACCHVDRFDVPAILIEARRVGNPAEPLVRALRGMVPAEAKDYVHHGATSQDILDTAAMLITRCALSMIDADLTAIAGSLAQLADEHRDTVMPGRTLLQQAVPITFGLKAAQWLGGVIRARASLRRLRREVLAVELGGGAGTLASLGNAGIPVLRAFSRQLDLAEPALPWHAERTRIGEIAAALALTAGALDKIALDIALLSQTEVGEVVEGGGTSRGGSSTMPHKQNPVGAVMARACAAAAQAQAGILLRSMSQEHERAAGAWQVEWPALSGALAGTGSTAAWLRQVMEGLQVRPERMRENLALTGGLIMAERISTLLAERAGREEAHNWIRTLSGRVREEGTSLREILLADDTVRRYLSPEEIERAMAPEHYLGSTQALIDRALALYRDSAP